MKIGFSFGRCLRDLVEDRVQMDDVLCIIARTLMPKESDVRWVINEYLGMPNYLGGLDPDRCHQLGVELWKSGRILEPRSNGIRPMSVPREYIWMDLMPTTVDVKNPAVEEAWAHYKLLLELTEQTPEYMDGVVGHSEKNPQADRANVDPLTPEQLEQLEQQRQAINVLVNSI